MTNILVVGGEAIFLRTYGSPKRVPIREDHPQLPINSYGRSKLMVEQILNELDTRKTFRSVILR